jgi:hypothetical protein
VRHRGFTLFVLLASARSRYFSEQSFGERILEVVPSNPVFADCMVKEWGLLKLSVSNFLERVYSEKEQCGRGFPSMNNLFSD